MIITTSNEDRFFGNQPIEMNQLKHSFRQENTWTIVIGEYKWSIGGTGCHYRCSRIDVVSPFQKITFNVGLNTKSCSVGI